MCVCVCVCEYACMCDMYGGGGAWPNVSSVVDMVMDSLAITLVNQTN